MAVRFLLLGDFGDSTDRLKRVATAMSDHATLHRIDGIFGLGDNFYPHGVTTPNDALFRAWELSFLVHASLRVKWYMLLGNHDYEGDINAQISRKCSFWTMPDRVYKVSLRCADTKVDFFIIDTNPSQVKLGLPTSQLTQDLIWLDRKLGASDADWKYVCGHHPLFTIGAHHQMQALKLHELHLYEILQKHNVDAYFAGHEHINEFRGASVPNYVAGSTSYAFHDKKGERQQVDWSDTRAAFIELVVTSTHATVNYVDADTCRVFFSKCSTRRGCLDHATEG